MMPVKKYLNVKTFRHFILTLFLVSVLAGCSAFRTASNISRLKYKIYSAENYKLLGMDLGTKKSIKDFNSLEILKLSTGLIKGNLPLTFILNVEALNPNDGSGGYPRTDLTITSFPYRLYFNDKETVTGDIKEEVSVPGKGESVLIPFEIKFDITKSLKEKSIDDILAFLLQLGGVKGSSSNLKLIAKPVLGTPFGRIEYPEEITIVDRSFN